MKLKYKIERNDQCIVEGDIRTAELRIYVRGNVKDIDRIYKVVSESIGGKEGP